MTRKNSKAAIGIIGAGRRGFGNYARNIAQRGDARLVALADPNGPRLESVSAALPAPPRCYPDARAMMTAEKLDGVIIASVDCTHEESALAVIERGVPVMVDKPLATTAAGCRRIIEAAEKRGTTVVVGFNLRHQAVLRLAKELIEAGEIGSLMLIENREFYGGGRTYMSRWNRRREWSGGLWVHKGSHDFDIFNWWNAAGKPARVTCLSGLNAFRPDRLPFAPAPGETPGPTCSACRHYRKCPDRIPRPAAGGPKDIVFNDRTAAVDGYRPDQCMYLSDKDTHDNGIALVEYDNNVRASHLECFAANFSDRLYTVVGDRGILELSLSRNDAIRFRPRWAKRDKLISVPPMPKGGHGGADPLLIDDFIRIARGEKTGSPATARDGLRSVAVGEAAEISWRERRTVEISELIDPACF